MNAPPPPPNFEAPLHRSLTEPMLLAGLPRTVALVLWTSIGAVVLGLHQVWMLPIGLVLHGGASMAARRDPHFFEVLLLALKHQRTLEP